MSAFESLRSWAKALKSDVMTLWFARQHPDTPWAAKLIGAVAVAYALSPIDLIPDFIPILGYLDDLLLVPVLVWAAIRLIPAHVLEESRKQADAFFAARERRPKSLWGATAIVILWAAALAVLYAWWTSARIAP